MKALKTHSHIICPLVSFSPATVVKTMETRSLQVKLTVVVIPPSRPLSVSFIIICHWQHRVSSDSIPRISRGSRSIGCQLKEALPTTMAPLQFLYTVAPRPAS